MRIGILTFHNVPNPGAFLQALGTQELLKSLGHEAYIIDYATENYRFSSWRILRSWNIKIVYRWRIFLNLLYKEKEFAKARAETFKSTTPANSAIELDSLLIDCVIIGADIVWDLSLPRVKNDPTYFGHGLSSKRLISFAASAGKYSNHETVPDRIIESLKSFSMISVRDLNTQKFVHRSIRRLCPILCDPAFHLDWRKFTREPRIKGRYALAYLLPGQFSKQYADQIKTFCRKQGIRLVSVYYHQPWADTNIHDCDPREWLGLIDSAEVVFTTTFHGTVFSIIMGKKFIIEYNDDVMLKTRDLIETFGLQDRVFDGSRQIASQVEADWDTDLAQETIQRLVAESEDFLKTSLANLT
jgi:hypothetical protein